MRYELENGTSAGTVEWKAPGEVVCDMEDASLATWLEEYFSAEDSYMSGPVECAGMALERRDASREAFTRATYQLAAYAYKVRSGDGRRARTYGESDA